MNAKSVKTNQTASLLIGDLWGGLAAMLVALPSAIAFGVLIYTVLGPEYAGQGAMAGILGAAALGIAAPLIGTYRRTDISPVRARSSCPVCTGGGTDCRNRRKWAQVIAYSSAAGTDHIYLGRISDILRCNRRGAVESNTFPTR